MKVRTGNFEFVTNINDDIRYDTLNRLCNISNENVELVYGIDYEKHAAHHYNKLSHVHNGMKYWVDAIMPEHADVKTGFAIDVLHKGNDTWTKSSISIFPIEDGVKREKPVVQFEQTKGFENLFHARNGMVLSTWVHETIRCPVVQYIVGEISFSDIVEKYMLYSNIPWDGMTTLFSMITEEQRRQLINEHTDTDNKWHVTDVIYQIELLANAELMNNMHDYDEFKKKFKREDILSAIRDCNRKGNHELQIFLNHCVPQETEEDRRKRWEL